jgi:hypothetical protein
MKNIPTALVFVLASLLCLAGCARARYPSYYTLSLPPAPDPIAEGVHAAIAVREFQSPSYLRQGPIVYRATPEQIGFYEYHRWATDPRMLLWTACAPAVTTRLFHSTMGTLIWTTFSAEDWKSWKKWMAVREPRLRWQCRHRSPVFPPALQSGATPFRKLELSHNTMWPASSLR